jgi:hypothetical protein
VAPCWGRARQKPSGEANWLAVVSSPPLPIGVNTIEKRHTKRRRRPLWLESPPFPLARRAGELSRAAILRRKTAPANGSCRPFLLAAALPVSGSAIAAALPLDARSRDLAARIEPPVRHRAGGRTRRTRL